MSGAFDFTAEQWATLRALLDEALELEASQRAAWLERLEGRGHGALKPRLARLLGAAEAHGTVHQLLNTLPKVETDQFAPLAAAEAPASAGEVIGPYRLIRELGSGGMASVWLAERVDMLQRRQVALKLPHGAWKRAGLAERMVREREILATLEHPNIARLYDAGLASDGQPYLALEYVEGERLDAYVRRKALDVPARLRLFLQVVGAVAHAHAQLVVHRDLKPSNVLVTAMGEVKLLDFGIAKLLERGVAAETALTQAAGRALTPDYAAPEQILGRPIGTSVDVYALGVVLYELLAGRRPYRLARESRAALEEAIVGAEAPRPSTVAPFAERKALQGDLDTIVLKALKKEPRERYRTAEAFGEDIERWLDGRPVLARPDSAGYRLRKFVARNRLVVGAVASATCALLAGTAVALWQARVAIDERQRAEEVKDFIASIFKEANPFQQGGGKALTGAELLRLAKDRLSARPSTDPATRVELLTLLGGGLLALEDVDSAAPVLALANEEASRTFGDAHPLALRAAIQSALLAQVREKPDEVRAWIEPRLPVLRRQRARQPADLTAALVVLAQVAAKQTRFDDVDAFVEEGRRVLAEHLPGRHADRLALLSVSALTLRQRGKGPEALQAAELAWQEARALHPDGHHPQVADARMAYGFILADNGRMRESMEHFRAALADTEALFGPESRRFASRLGNSSEIFAEAGNVREAIGNAERARSILAPMAPPRSRLDAASSEVVGLAHLWSREGETAARHLEQAEDIYRELFGAGHWTVLVTRRNRSLALNYAGRLDEARALLDGVQAQSATLARDGFDANAWIAGVRERLAGHLEGALRWQRQSIASMPDEAGNQAPRVRALAERGLIELDLGDTAAARLSFEEALRLHERRGGGLVAAAADAHLGLARIELAEGHASAALKRLQRVDDFWRELGARHRWAGEAAYWRARAHATLGQPAEAAEARDRAIAALRGSRFPADARRLAELTR